MYKNFVNDLPDNMKHCFASVAFGADGSPVFKSSTTSIWLLQLIINELPFDIRYSNVIVFALWFGRNKPKPNPFFTIFIEEMNNLGKNGIVCEINNERKKIHFFGAFIQVCQFFIKRKKWLNSQY